jgi:hypothetical protein
MSTAEGTRRRNRSSPRELVLVPASSLSASMLNTCSPAREDTTALRTIPLG